MPDDVFTVPGFTDAPAPAQDAERPFKPGFLPDGTRLLLTASRACDLADVWGEDFLDYYPRRQGEWGMLLYMATHEPKDWRDARGALPPLIRDFDAFRNVVSEFLDSAFRVAEIDQIRVLALDLWHTQNAHRVVPSEVQKKTEADPPSIPSPPSSPTSAPSPEETPAAETSS